MAIFHYFLFDFQIVKTSLPCHYAIFKQLLDTFAVSAFFDDFFQNFTARIFARARKEKGEAAESKRPGERVNWKLWFEMSGTFPLAFFDDFAVFGIQRCCRVTRCRLEFLGSHRSLICSIGDVFGGSTRFCVFSDLIGR